MSLIEPGADDGVVSQLGPDRSEGVAYGFTIPARGLSEEIELFLRRAHPFGPDMNFDHAGGNA